MRQLKRFTTVNSLAAILLLLTFALLSFDRFHAEEVRENNVNLERCMRTFRELLSHKGEGFSIAAGKLLAGSYLINGNFEVPDKVQEIFGVTATVFMGDQRVSTNILQTDGSRAVGTRLEGPAYDAVFRQGKAFRGETRILGVPYFTAYDPIRDSNGKIIGALCVGMKKSAFLAQFIVMKIEMMLILLGLSAVFITFMILFNRVVKKAERTKEADHRFLQTLMDTIPNPVFYKDVHGKYLGGNKAFAEFYGLPIEQLIGKTVFDIFPLERANEVHKSEQKLLQKQNLLVDETSIIHADGTSRDVISFMATFPAADGSLGGMIGTILDISERKRMEDELRTLSFGIEQSQVSIVITDRKGIIKYVNPKFTQMTGYTPAEAVGQNPRILKSGLTPPEDYQQLWNTILSGREWHGKWCNKKKNGDMYWESASISPVFDAQGGISNFVAVKEDITDRRQLEMELLKAKEMAEEANRLKSEFLANMSHAIRTPMNGVIGMTDLLMDTDLNKDQLEFVLAIESSADSLLTVINDILDFSKIEARKLELDPINFNLRGSLGKIIQTLAYRAAEKGLELAFCVPQDVPNAVVGDPGRLRQIIVNLVANAIKFTERGEVVLSVTTEQDREDKVCLHFTVADTGIGIPAAKQQRIFNPFSQADASTTRKYGGTGLGLSISARLVEMMGGRIRVESEVGKGSTFHFTVCFGLQQGPQIQQLPEEPAFLEGLKVLVVDDNATNRRILEEMLKNWRMQPFMADCGQAALQLLAEARQAGEPFRLLLLDVSMSGMDGFELVKRIKASQEDDGATIIMLTSFGQQGDAARCRELGISAYLNKPIGQSPLLDAILTVLGKRVPKSAAPTLVTLHTLLEGKKTLRILLAEDNPVNQKIAVRMLEKRGHAVIIAENGREAVAAIAGQGKRPFDLVLMDVQMPEMDGIEATALIREEEKASGKHVHIIALTARAMEGDREICLTAGMDGYIAKPLRAEALFVAIETLINVHDVITPEVRSVRRTEAGVFNQEEALDRVDGDWDLFREVVGIFAANSSKLLAEIRNAIAEGNVMGLNRAAHTLKGSVVNFGASAAFEAAQKLELLGKQGNLADAPEFFTALEGEIESLLWSLASFSGGMEHENTDSRR